MNTITGFGLASMIFVVRRIHKLATNTAERLA